MVRKVLFLTSLLSALAACASAPLVLPPPPAALPDNDMKIVPGERIGNLVIGMSSKQLLDAKGEPKQTFGYPRGAQYEYADDLSIDVAEDILQVEEIVASGSQYSTAEGVHPGNTVLSLRANYGEPDEYLPGGPTGKEWSVWCYEKRGLMAWVQEDGSISELGVFRPGNYCIGTAR